jgi:hypothetical protein
MTRDNKFYIKHCKLINMATVRNFEVISDKFGEGRICTEEKFLPNVKYNKILKKIIISVLCIQN